MTTTRRPARPRAAGVPTVSALAAARSRGRGLGLRSLALLLGVAAVVGGAGWVVLATPVLGVRAVEVQGAVHVPAAEVRAAAAVPPGTPLARVDGSAVARRVLGRLRGVATVDVTRAWPSTLRLRVTERQAAGAVATTAGVRLVDAEGVAFARAPRRPAGVPLLEGARDGVPSRAAVAAAIQVAGALPAALRDDVRIIRATSPDAVALRLDSGATVVWGSPEDSERKARVLIALMKQKADVYDVSAPDVPTVRGARRS